MAEKEKLPYQEVIDELREEAQDDEDLEYLREEEETLDKERKAFEDAHNKQPVEPELTESGGIILTGSEKEKIQKGEGERPTPYGDSGRRT